MKAFTLRLETRQGDPLSGHLFKLLLARAIRQTQKIKKIQIGKEKAKLPQFTSNIQYIGNPRYHWKFIRNNKWTQQERN